MEDARAQELARGRDDTGTWDALTDFGWPAQHVPSARDEAKAARDEPVRVARVRRRIRERRRREPVLFGPLWGGSSVKWTPEEQRYVERVQQLFDLLDLPPGTLLRDYLADRLDCDSLRISKKFAGDASIGKRFFRPDASASAETKEEARREVAELEAAWRRARAPKLKAAWRERRAAICAWLPWANAALAVVGELARGKAALATAETAEALDAAIAGCERVRDHVASLRRQLRLREELEILRRDNDRLKRIREAKIEELREELEQLRRDNDRLKRTKKRKTSNVTGAVSGGDVEMSEAPSPGT